MYAVFVEFSDEGRDQEPVELNVSYIPIVNFLSASVTTVVGAFLVHGSVSQIIFSSFSVFYYISPMTQTPDIEKPGARSVHTTGESFLQLFSHP